MRGFAELAEPGTLCERGVGLVSPVCHAALLLPVSLLLAAFAELFIDIFSIYLGAALRS